MFVDQLLYSSTAAEWEVAGRELGMVVGIRIAAVVRQVAVGDTTVGVQRVAEVGTVVVGVVVDIAAGTAVEEGRPVVDILGMVVVVEEVVVLLGMP